MGLDAGVPTLRRTQTEAAPVQSKHKVASKLQSETEVEPELLRRPRSRSIPASFCFGGYAADEDATAAGLRPRSFGSWGPTGSAKEASLTVLNARIQEQELAVDDHSSLFTRKRRGSAMLRSMARFFSNTKKKEASHLRRMQMAVEAAKCHRSLTILNDIRTLVLMTEDSDFSATPRASYVDATIQRLLDGVASADQVLSEDTQHHILALQAEWLKRTAEFHQSKETQHLRARSGSCLALQLFLDKFEGGSKNVSAVSMDRPSAALMEFEDLIIRHRLMKPKTKRAFDRLCADTMIMFAQSNMTAASQPTATSFWNARESRQVLLSIVEEIVDSILEDAWVADKHRATLRVFVEQMVFSRLAPMCYRGDSVDLDEKNTEWREQAMKARGLSLHDVGLRMDVPMDAAFPKSITAFSRLPYLVPVCVASSFMDAIRVLHKEAEEVLERSTVAISADVILPLLVFVLSRSELPHLHSQLYLMEHFALDAAQDGSELSYYLASVRAAVGYIMALDH